LQQAWWKEAVIYQIYPRSFADSNGDGVGDLRGIIGKLDYLKELGVDVVWLSPVYRTPNADNGYDIADYQAIDPAYGTLADWEEMLDGMHRRGIKLVMDLVVGHTSDEHPWFVESATARDNPKRDWYFWRPGRAGGPPSNWRSQFGGTAWEHDPKTDEYYLHYWTVKQADLNWENPAVRREIYQMMRWWLDKGIDGFRMDVINAIKKRDVAADLADPADRNNYFNNPGIHDLIQEMNREALSGYDIFTVGECPGVTPDMARLYVDADRREMSMLFHFEHMDMKRQGGFDLRRYKEIQKKWYNAIFHTGWNSQYLGNHDQPRCVSWIGSDGQYRMESAKALATMNLTLPGTPYVYQGDEIGMTNVAFERIEDYNDPQTVGRYHEAVAGGADPAETFDRLRRISRDNARTPFQWSAAANAGFTAGKPWLPVNPNYPKLNLEADMAHPGSIFRHHQAVIRLRREYPALVYGEYRPYQEDDPHLYLYERATADQRMLVALNLSGEEHELTLPAGNWQIVNANYAGDRTGRLAPWEARIYRGE
jgi:oligo-1,6-glucosidase